MNDRNLERHIENTRNDVDDLFSTLIEEIEKLETIIDNLENEVESLQDIIDSQKEEILELKQEIENK
jgi:peptidoglycan hydrolase CwlO-like protein